MPPRQERTGEGRVPRERSPLTQRSSPAAGTGGCWVVVESPQRRSPVPGKAPKQVAAFPELFLRLRPARPGRGLQLSPLSDATPARTTASLSRGSGVPSAPAAPAPFPCSPFQPLEVSFLPSLPPCRGSLPPPAPSSGYCPHSLRSGHTRPSAGEQLSSASTLLSPPPSSPLPSPVPATALGSSSLPRPRSFHTNSHSSHSSLPPFKLQGK